MSRQATATVKKFWALLLSALMALTGCHPTQPFYLHEDGDLSHYIDTATDIEYADVEALAMAEAECTKEPLTIINPHFDEFWDLSLEEAICIALKNSKVIRTFGLGASRVGQGLSSFVPDRVLSGVDTVATVYDPALVEANPGSVGLGTGTDTSNTSRYRITAPGSGTPGRLSTGEPGVEAALAAFDTRLEAGMFWDKRDRAQNSSGAAVAIFPTVSQQDLISNWVQLSKRTAVGTELFMRTTADYTQSNAGFRALPSDWLATIELEARQPLLKGAGAQVNRMNVMVARINTDLSLADFEIAARNLVSDVEWVYWDLYFQYRNLESQKAGRDSALVSWKKVKTKAIVGVPGGEADKEAQARQQYFRFRSNVEAALQTVFTTENRMRYIMGLAATDGRMIRPADEPVTAKVQFDWRQILSESLHRSPEIRKQNWRIKRRELELVLARNGLLPRLDAVGVYKWLGVGDDLIAANRRGLNFAAPGSLAWDELTEGKYQEFSFGFKFEMPIGFRQELAGVRWAQLGLAREKARFEDMELELSHALTGAYQDVDAFYQNMQTNFNWRVAAQREVDAVEAAYEAGTVTLDLLLRAQQARADAETAYYNSLKEYNLAIARVHWRKGSLLEYNGVMLAEGPWPEKAYFDALGHARRRDASFYLDYGYTRPGVMSRGPVDQMGSGAGVPAEMMPEMYEMPAGPIEDVEVGPEILEVPPVPMPEEGDVERIPMRAPAETATRPAGPQLAPPLLKSAGRQNQDPQPVGAGVKQDKAYDWSVLESRLSAAPVKSALRRAVAPASHETPDSQPTLAPIVTKTSVNLQQSTGNSNAKAPTAKPTTASGWKPAN